MSALFRAVRTADFDDLYRRYAASVYRYAYAVLGNHADAEDVAQQTFMNAYRAIAQGTKPAKPENWLFTIAHNEVRRHLRNAHGKAFEVELDDQLPTPAADRSDPSLADVLRALQHLPPTQRSALVMREFEGRSYAEIAEIMNVTQSALEAQIFRARRALAEHLEGALTCVEAEEALLRRLDGRLPRRIARRLKAHLQECPVCTRFADVQKRQRDLLKGLSVMPIPASLFLFRGEQAAASVGVGSGGVAVGSAVVGGGGSTAVAAGTTGIAAGVAAKAAAVTAAAAVAGGVGYGVTTHADTAKQPTGAVAAAAVVPVKAEGRRAVKVRSTPPQSRRVRTVGPARAGSKRNAPKAKTPSRKAVRHAKKPTKALTVAVRRRAAPKKSALVVKQRPMRPLPAKPAAPPRSKPQMGRRLGQSKPEAAKPVRPARAPVEPPHGTNANSVKKQ